MQNYSTEHFASGSGNLPKPPFFNRSFVVLALEESS